MFAKFSAFIKNPRKDANESMCFSPFVSLVVTGRNYSCTVLAHHVGNTSFTAQVKQSFSKA